MRSINNKTVKSMRCVNMSQLRSGPSDQSDTKFTPRFGVKGATLFGLVFSLFGSIFSMTTEAYSQAVAQKKESSGVSQTVFIQAADVLTSYLSKDFGEIGAITKKLTVASYNQSELLPAGLQPYLLKKIEQASRADANSPVLFVECLECLSLRAEAQGDEIFIKKGVASKEDMKKLLAKINVQKYADINVAYDGRHLILQISLKTLEGLTEWAREYRTPVSAYSDSQWLLGAEFDGVMYFDKKMPSTKGGSVYVGQRLFGIGAVGLTGSVYSKTDELPQAITAGGFFELNHNEFFRSYWSVLELSYVVVLGITDFNGKQQLAEGLGLKTKIGQYFTLRLMGNMNQFIQTPTDKSYIANPKNQEILRNSDPLPPRLTIGLGFEL